MPLTLNSVQNLSFQSIATAGTDYRALAVADQKPGTAVGLALGLSETRAYRLTRGILSTAADQPTYEKDAGDLVKWAKTAGSQERQIVAKALNYDSGKKGKVFLIQQISQMKRTDARAFTKDYFDAGGDTAAIATWLQGAGRAIRKHDVKADDTLGFVGDAVDWVVDAAGDVVDAIVEGVTGIVDAIVDAGRSLVDFIGDVISWSVEAVGDLVEALVAAGQSIFEILEAAVAFSVEAVTKFVRALVDIGRSIGEIITEGLRFAAGVMRTIVNTIGETLSAVGDILVWAAGQVRDITRRVVEALIDVGRSVVQILRTVVGTAIGIVRDVVRALLDIGRTIGELLIIAITEPASFFDAVVAAAVSIRNSVTEMMDSIVGRVADGVRELTAALVRAGRSVLELARWAVGKAVDIMKDVLRGLIAAGKRAVEIITDVARQTVTFIKEVLTGLMDIGRTVVNLIRDLATLTVELARKVFRALTDLAGALVKFAAEVVQLTYRVAAELVGLMIDAGLAVADIVATTVGASYWVFRRIINGIIARTGSFGEVLDEILRRGEAMVSETWEDVMQAARFAGAQIKDAIAWAVDQTDEAFAAILNGWETMGESLKSFYDEAARLAQNGIDGIWEKIGVATMRLENSVLYVLTYIEQDYLPGMRDFMKGLLDAGYVVAELVVDLANLGAQAMIRGFEVLLELGNTLGELIAATMENPEDLLPNLLEAATAAGTTGRELWETVFVDTGGQFTEEVVQAWRDLGRPINDMLLAAAEVAGGGVATIVSLLLSQLASYRPMTARERRIARLVYGDSFDYDRVYFSAESLSNDIIFGIQDAIRQSGDSRAFVTNNLVNFDNNDNPPITDSTMIHELGHVWQFRNTGSFYMAEAIHAQTTPEKYNYGNTNSQNGDGAENVLADLVTDNPGLSVQERFDTFNREQQCDILMHYYVRRHEEGRPRADWAAWEPYQQLVAA